MDAFYASVEQHDNPELKGKPIAVGGSIDRGVVAAASYEARTYGVKSAMPSSIAARRCPQLIFVKPRFERYKEISQQIREVFFEYTDLVEPLSLDEAYLDVTQTKIGLPSATIIAKEIKDKIKSRTGLTASAGISYCKFLAKTASDVKKPDGLFVILPEEAEGYLKKMPIHQFHGIGKATAEKMKVAGIFTGNDLRKKSLEDLTRRYGKAGAYYYNICRGIDDREVKQNRERKSVSAERTFDRNIIRMPEITQELERIIQITFERYKKFGLPGKTVTVKIKYGDFQQITRSDTLNQPIEEMHQLQNAILSLVDQKIIREEGIRLLGVGISNFQRKDRSLEPTQLTLNF
ncbi:DNA polymerase-4 [Marinoscillum furvescens DSM 4134]|uniref:DNA polymerase IV n=2 Tax=Marinoscillum furvescens TaxID=1026 RepID=A0A3D9L3R7_MARFU|nr:DNA polymerase-4 [Marinoscillum furvescens DSM 4134]